MTITIHTVTTIEECRIIEQLEIEIWGTIELDVTPASLLAILSKEGGIVLLALDGTEAVGFSYSLPGLTKDNRLKLVSHQTGVRSAYQNSGVGYQLKLAQREAALVRQFDLVTWTFDPLQGRNAYLNLYKLGGVCRTYLRHLYGDMPDALNRGLPSDRFRVDWWIASPHVTRRLAGQSPSPMPANSPYPLINPAPVLSHGFLAAPSTFDPPASSCCWLQVPPDFPLLKASAPELALQWRLHTRALFETYFNAGYTAVDFCRGDDRKFYLLQKDWQQET
jgi:predicted GNAT superfamily acetyltransferase